MCMPLIQVIILAVIQGLAELLPVSSSAHVIVAEKLMGLDPTTPQMTLLLVMLHTGTMFSVIVYFWKSWKQTYFSSVEAFNRFAGQLLWATLLTGILGEALRKFLLRGPYVSDKNVDIETFFGRLDLLAPALAAAGGVLASVPRSTPPNGRAAARIAAYGHVRHRGRRLSCSLGAGARATL